MSNAVINTTYFRGQGPLWIATRDASGQTGGFYPIGDAENCTISFQEQYDDVRESISGARTRVVHTSVQSDANFQIDLRSFDSKNLARAILGTQADVAGGSVVDQEYVAYVGKSIFLAHVKVSAVTVKSQDSSPTTYVAGTDYVLDGDSGRISILESGSIEDEEPLNISYTYAAQHTADALSNVANREYILVGDFINMNQQGTPVRLTMKRAYMNLPSNLAFLNAATATLQVTGSLLPDENGDLFDVKILSESEGYTG